jgi:uncharacterized protein
VLPAEHHAHEPTTDEAECALVRLAAASLGVATAADLADYYRMRPAATKGRIAELTAAGELCRVRVEGWKEDAYMPADLVVPRRVSAAALLSPFDPLVWYRPRAERLFGFDYRIEIYTPSAKRRYGYYVLPFLLGERIVGRVDLKTDRAGGSLRVLAAHHEPHAAPEDIAPALATELAAMARWLGVPRVTVERKGKLANALRAAVRSI